MKFRKKPMVVNAVQWKGTQESFDEILALGNIKCEPSPMGAYTFILKTYQGEFIVFKDDWVVKNENGEYYRCKPDIFEQTYDALSD